MRKSIMSLFLILCMCLPLTVAFAEDTSDENKAPAFTDVTETHIAYEAVSSLVQQGVINGKSETEFAPDDFLTREEFAKIISLALKLSSGSNSTVFYDVPIGTWYADFVSKAASAGLIKGVAEGRFGVGQTLSRQDLAVILKRRLDSQKVDFSSLTSILYADDAEISNYAREAVSGLSAAGIMKGRENNCWCPKSPVTRAEAAIAVYESLSAKKKQDESLGRYGGMQQYQGPFDVPLDDRLAEAMPTPFNANTASKQVIVDEDFEDADFGILQKGGWGSNATLLTEGGYNGGGCLQVKGDEFQTTNTTLSWKANTSELAPGDFLVFSARIKGEVTGGGGHYRARMSVYDDQPKWLDETHTGKTTKSRDWGEFQYLLMVPEGVNALTESKFFTVNLIAYTEKISGTFYFDDFKLYKIKFPPMNTVLMTPNYKGIIKGENGIGDITMRAYVDDLNGLWDLSKFNYTARITDEEKNILLESKTDTVTSAMDICFSSATLPMGGDYYLESILTDKETGEEIQRFEWPLHKREADFETVIGIDEYGRVTKNGVPCFPISTYNWDTYGDVLKDISSTESVDNLMHSGMGWYYSFGTSSFYRNLIDELVENGKTISLATGSIAYSNMYTGEVKNRVTKQTDIRGLLTKLATNFKDLPNLYSYYIFDEQNAARYGDEIAWARKIIESIDMDHPTTCAIDNPLNTRRGIYAKTSDFLGYDPYPVTGKESQDIAMVYNRLSDAKKNNPNRPIYAILQSFWYNGRGDLRGPTEEEFRNMAFQAIVAGSCMLDAFGYRAMKATPSPGRTGDEEWNEVVGIYDEIHYLEPIILSVEPAPYYEIKGGGEWLNTMTKRHNGKSYLFTVNNVNDTKSAAIHLEGVKEIKGMYSKEVYEADENGYFEIEWDEYGVEVFEFEQADYKSPHAELETFGFADAITIDMDSEIQTVIFPNDKTEYSYSARTSDFSTLYINGEKSEKTGTIDISSLSEINIKVVSEDGRFSTEKTYLIKRS